MRPEHKPGAVRLDDPSLPAAPRPAVASESSWLSQQILQNHIVQHEIRHQTLQLRVLVLKLLEAHRATGMLTFVGKSVPLTLDFDLELANGVATMSGSTVLDRRDFGIGTAYPDESSVGFPVAVLIELTATQPQ